MLEPEQLKTWLVKVARKDAAAFRALYDATSPKLFGFALRILHKRELAEEVLQESFVSIWNNAATYQSSLAAPMTWMSTIVRNKAFDALRKHYPHRRETDGLQVRIAQPTLALRQVVQALGAKLLSAQ